MSSTLREQAAKAQSIGEIQLSLAAKLNEAADIADQVGGIEAPVIIAAEKSTAKRGRPKNSPAKKTPKKAVAKKDVATKSVSTKATKKSGRGRRNGSKSMKDMVVATLKGRKKGLGLKEIVKHIIDSGYETKSKDAVNVVYQAVYKLMKDEKITDDQRVEKVDKNYRLISAVAA